MGSNIQDINFLFHKYYGDNPELRRIVTIHSQQVARKALQIRDAKNLPLDPIDVFCAGMLHDIGVVKCSAPDIFAFGALPYIRHGLEGKKILEKNGLNKYASICVTHTGSGISKENIKNNKIPLPIKDYLPTTLLEKLICYCDKFYSKSHNLTKEKSVEQIITQLEKFGEDSVKRFLELHELFNCDNK